MIFTVDMWKIRNEHQAYFAYKLVTISFYDAFTERMQAVRNEEVNFSLKYCVKTYMCAIK